MISVYQLKSKFSDILRPLVNFIVKIGITANMVTISAFILSIITGVIIYLYAPKCACVYWILPISLFIRMALNNIDGVIAREHNQKSNIGAIYNELGDILSDIVIYVPLLYVCGCCYWLIFAFTILTIISETVGIMGVQIGASRHYDGPMGKSDRAFWFSILAIVLVYIQIPTKALSIFMGIVIALLGYTCFNRINGALKEAESK
jgi:phosphatidylglycerophosphate synthase